VKAIVESAGKVASRVRVRSHDLLFDQPATIPGGEDRGPSPLDVLVAAVAACAHYYAAAYLHGRGFPTLGLSVAVEADKERFPAPRIGMPAGLSPSNAATIGLDILPIERIERVLLWGRRGTAKPGRASSETHDRLRLSAPDAEPLVVTDRSRGGVGRRERDRRHARRARSRRLWRAYPRGRSPPQDRTFRSIFQTPPEASAVCELPSPRHDQPRRRGYGARALRPSAAAPFQIPQAQDPPSGVAGWAL
jgi:hypothetical protein